MQDDRKCWWQYFGGTSLIFAVTMIILSKCCTFQLLITIKCSPDSRTVYWLFIQRALTRSKPRLKYSYYCDILYFLLAGGYFRHLLEPKSQNKKFRSSLSLQYVFSLPLTCIFIHSSPPTTNTAYPSSDLLFLHLCSSLLPAGCSVAPTCLFFTDTVLHLFGGTTLFRQNSKNPQDKLNWVIAGTVRKGRRNAALSGNWGTRRRGGGCHFTFLNPYSCMFSSSTQFSHRTQFHCVFSARVVFVPVVVTLGVKLTC